MTATAPREAAYTPSSDTMHVVARVGTERFAFRVADVEEVVDAPMLIPVHGAPDGLSGQLVHRDQTVRVYDAAWAFGTESAQMMPTPPVASRSAAPRPRVAATALVLRVADDRVALLVDDVEDLTALDATGMRAVPAGADPGGLLRGVCLPRAGDAGIDTALIGVVNTVAMVARASSRRGAAVEDPTP